MAILSVHSSKDYIKKPVAVSIEPALAARAETEDRAATATTPLPGVVLSPGALALSVQGLRNYQNLPMAQPAIAASPDDLVLATDDQFAIFDKGGTNRFQSSLFQWFANSLPASSSWSVSEPQLLYDVAYQRYVLAASALSFRDRLSRVCLSVPSRFPVIDSPGFGLWTSFSIDAKLNHTIQTENYVDAIRIGMNRNTVVVTGNMFSFLDNSFQYAKLWAIPKAQLYNPAGGPLTSGFTDWDFKNADGSVASSLVPAQSYESGSIAYIVSAYDPGSGIGDKLTLFKVDTTNFPPALPARLGHTFLTAGYSVPPDAEQAGTTKLITTWDARFTNAILMPSGLWTVQPTGLQFAGDAAVRSGLHWLQIDPVGNRIIQQGYYGAPGIYFYYPAIAPDPTGNAVLVFNGSSATTHVGAYYTSRRSGDAANTFRGYAPLRTGQGCYDRSASGTNTVGFCSAAAWDPLTGHDATWLLSAFVVGSNNMCSANTWDTWLGMLPGL